MPFISVIIPAYNAENTIRETVSDILAQTWQDYEIILVDDGSADDTPAICDAIASEQDRVRVIHQENRGPSNARNTGTACALGKYVTYVDSDDRIREDMLEQLTAALEKTGADIACGRIERKAGITDRPKVEKESESVERFECRDALREMLTGKKLWVGPWCRLVPRQWMLDAPFLDGKYYEDLSNTWKVNLKAGAVAFVDAVLYYYVTRKGSITRRRQVTKEQCLDYYEAIHMCAEGVLRVYPDLRNDAAVLVARDYMSLFLHLHRCGEKTDRDLLLMEGKIRRWMRRNWKRAACNKAAPDGVRLRVLLFALSPWLYEQLYYIGIRFAGKGIA